MSHEERLAIEAGERELDETTKQECEMIRGLRERGFAVIVWNPGELDGVNPNDLEESSVRHGWEYIEMFGQKV